LNDFYTALATLKKLEKSISKIPQIKAVVTGPFTLASALSVGTQSKYKSNKDHKLVTDISEALIELVKLIVSKKLCSIIQVDEPILATKDAPDNLDILNSFFDCIPIPVLHVCGDTSRILNKLLSGLNISQIMLETSKAKELSFIPKRLMERRGIIPCLGCIETRTNTVETEEVIANRITRFIRYFDAVAELYLSPDCGMRNLKVETARQKLRNMVRTAERIVT
jgi:methionine synthase II (cobalamin-independent)